MPIYFFDVVANDHLTVDHQCHEFVDPEHAHKEAVRTIAAIAAEEIPKDGTLSLTVSVADASHHVLFKTHVQFDQGYQRFLSLAIR